MSMYRFETEPCPMCNGLGHLIDRECPNCKGYGKVVVYKKKDPPKRKKGKKK